MLSLLFHLKFKDVREQMGTFNNGGGVTFYNVVCVGGGDNAIYLSCIRLCFGRLRYESDSNLNLEKVLLRDAESALSVQITFKQTYLPNS